MSNPNPVTPPPGRGRRKGSRNTVPANAALKAYRQNLLRAADAGDINAAGWLLAIDTLERQKVGK